MAEVGTVVAVDRQAGIVTLGIVPPSCGRCDTDGGHCDHEIRHVQARVPSEYREEIRVGYRVSIGITADAAWRAVWRLLVAPGLVGAAVLAALWTSLGATADPPLLRGAATVAAVLATLGVAAGRGSSSRDLPMVRDLLDGSSPELTPVSLSIPARAGVAVDSVSTIRQERGIQTAPQR